MSSRLEEIQERLGIRFVDERLLARALVHRSYAFENGGLIPNERLEFLGDSVLSIVVTDEIFHLQPDAAEGRLAKIRAAAVKTASLAQVGRDLGLGEFVRLGKGEAASGGAAKQSILADTLEAIIGAYYLDRGFHAAYDLVQGLFADRLRHLVGSSAALDYKTSLQELSASRHGSLPVYEVTDVGPDHEKTFTATVSVDGGGARRGPLEEAGRAACGARGLRPPDGGHGPAAGGRRRRDGRRRGRRYRGTGRGRHPARSCDHRPATGRTPAHPHALRSQIGSCATRVDGSTGHLRR